MNDTYMESPLTDLHRAAGAELGTYFGVTLPAQFTDPVAEHQIARQSAVVIDTNFRSVFSLAGPDRARYLNAVLTSNVRDLLPGQGTIGLLLNAQGHILAELETLACADRILVLGHALRRAKTAETLDKFIIMDDATLADESGETGTLAIEGPLAALIVRELTQTDLSALPLRGHVPVTVRCVSGEEVPCRMIHHSLFGFPGAEFLVGRQALGALWRTLESAVRAHGGAPAGYRALNALRLEAGIPWFGVDFDERQIPHEAGLEGTHISFTKGCYTGQEIVERVRSRGHVNRRLTALQFSALPPDPGTALLAAGVEAGHVTSAAFSPLAGTAIGMGYVRRESNKPGAELECGNATAKVITLPLPAAAPVAG